MSYFVTSEVRFCVSAGRIIKSHFYLILKIIKLDGFYKNNEWLIFIQMNFLFEIQKSPQMVTHFMYTQIYCL